MPRIATAGGALPPDPELADAVGLDVFGVGEHHRPDFTVSAPAVVLAAAAAGRFVLRRTTLNPIGEPSRLVASGAHAWSRNPMYLALTVVYIGLALSIGRAWPLILVVLPWASMNWAVIPFEEARLSATFGQDFADYCRRVRRWI